MRILPYSPWLYVICGNLTLLMEIASSPKWHAKRTDWSSKKAGHSHSPPFKSLVRFQFESLWLTVSSPYCCFVSKCKQDLLFLYGRITFTTSIHTNTHFMFLIQFSAYRSYSSLSRGTLLDTSNCQIKCVFAYSQTYLLRQRYLLDHHMH